MKSSISAFKVRLAIQKINSGEIIAYPTEAVYGLGCDPLNKVAVLNLLKLKQRPIEKGLILIASSLEQLAPYLLLNDSIISQVQSTWPGPVTWVIPAQPWVPDWLTGKHSSLAVRVTSHPIAQLLCKKNGFPIVSTSANINTQVPATSSWSVSKKIGFKSLYIMPGQVGGLKQATPIYDVLNHSKIR